ncbi:MAG: ABC transporter ATP-binding protein [Candidatus Dormibacteraeota bacterium]|nr:ABC transporter ATP-binding protein [Candidatus Dormibacteraeota bacterium]
MTPPAVDHPGRRTPAISLRDVGKSYRGKPAVRALNLEVEAGELIAVVGPNGAGKTTTIEMIEGYRRPDEGRISVLGLDPVADHASVRPLMGLMLQEGGIYPTIRVREAMQLFSSYFARPEPISDLLERVGLSDRGDRLYRQLSGGEKQRLSLALALIGTPLILFLDEPTAGMDPRARLLTWEVIKERQALGVTVVLTTHSMEEAERLADRVAVIKGGTLVAFDSPERLRAGAGPEQVQLQLREPLTQESVAALGRLPGVVRVLERGHGAYDFACDEPPRVAAELTALLARDGIAFNQLRIGRSSLEEVFLDLTDEGA